MPRMVTHRNPSLFLSECTPTACATRTYVHVLAARCCIFTFNKTSDSWSQYCTLMYTYMGALCGKCDHFQVSCRLAIHHHLCHLFRSSLILDVDCHQPQVSDCVPHVYLNMYHVLYRSFFGYKLSYKETIFLN